MEIQLSLYRPKFHTPNHSYTMLKYFCKSILESDGVINTNTIYGNISSIQLYPKNSL